MSAASRSTPSIGAALGAQDFAHEQRGLLGLIDKLQFAQLDNVKLPQIVVVGDQSAGKSSVLWALTGIPFPRDAGACTRFATEIRLRRAKEDKFSVRIIPDKKRTLSERQRLQRFGDDVDPSMSFESLMRHAIKQIAPKNEPGRFVSEDKLVVEKSGPDMELLTVVDLPGLVQNPNNEQSAYDIKAISDLNDQYMKSSRTIILAVVAGNQDFINAPVLTKARRFDPAGARTMGVLTKPDLTESIGLEDKFIALVSNKDQHNYFALGWYVLLNPGPRDNGQEWPTVEERKQVEEQFFTQGKWATLPRSICGAAALKQKLSSQLQRHIGKHMKTLQNEIQKAHNDCVAKLKSLGDGKDTVEEMREELIQRCSDSKELITPAVHGTYTNPLGQTFFPMSMDHKGTPPQKLRARVVEENLRFAEKVRIGGQRLHFTTPSDSDPQRAKKPGQVSKEDFIREEVAQLLKQNRGTEFPTDYNPRLVYTLFQSHSANWAMLAQSHKDNLGRVCNEFLGEVIDYVWPERMRESMRREYLDAQITQILEKAQKEVNSLQHDLQFEIEPYDPEYQERLNKWREGKTYTVAEELLEKMLIYYDLSAKVFIRNVITQVIERHLLEGLRGLFSWISVSRMKDDTVLAIAAEDKATREQRITLKNQKTAIEEAREMCANLAMRKELRSYGLDDSNEDAESSDEEGSKPSRRINRKQPESSAYAHANDGYYDAPANSQQAFAQYNERAQATAAKLDRTQSHSHGSNYHHVPEPGASSPAKGRADPPTPLQTRRDYTPDKYDPYTSENSHQAPNRMPPTPPRSRDSIHDDAALAARLQAEENARGQGSNSAPQNVDVPGTFPEQYSATESSGRGKQTYPPLDQNGARTYLNTPAQPPPPKPRKGLFGSRS